MEYAKSKRSLVVSCPQATDFHLTMQEARAKGLLDKPTKVGWNAALDDMRNPRLFRGSVKLDGEWLAMSEYAFDSETGTLTLELGPGEHQIEVKAGDQP